MNFKNRNRLSYLVFFFVLFLTPYLLWDSFRASSKASFFESIVLCLLVGFLFAWPIATSLKILLCSILVVPHWISCSCGKKARYQKMTEVYVCSNCGRVVKSLDQKFREEPGDDYGLP